jgi:hypothetical protein
LFPFFEGSGRGGKGTSGLEEAEGGAACHREVIAKLTSEGEEGERGGTRKGEAALEADGKDDDEPCALRETDY